jgi:hypothetical protein
MENRVQIQKKLISDLMPKNRFFLRRDLEQLWRSTGSAIAKQVLNGTFPDV